jgi:hypothetical protein
MANYQATKVEDALNDNMWLVTKTNDDGTVKQDHVFCSASANTEQDAVNVFKETENPVEIS